MMNPSCTDAPAEEKYSFYEHIDNYLEYEKFCYHDQKCNIYNEKCKSIGISGDGMQDTRYNICVRFHYLIENIIKSTYTSDDPPEYADLAYLNYWLNYELHNKNANIEPKVFHQYMKYNDRTNTKLSKLNNKMIYIDEAEANDMFSLYYLYKDYINIRNSVIGDNPSEELFQHHTKHCVEKYQEHEDKCLDKTTPFRKALCNFRKKYEQIDLSNEAINEWQYQILPPLSKYAKAQGKASKLPSASVHPSLADTGISERTHRTPITSSESLERGSEGPVKPDAMSETITDIESIAEDGSHQPAAISHLPDISQQKSLKHNEQIEVQNDDHFDTSTNKIIGTSISTLGVSSLFFLFYKFTSLGSRFRSQNKSKKYNRNNFDQQSNNFLDTPEYQYIPEESMSYNISYNSV